MMHSLLHRSHFNSPIGGPATTDDLYVGSNESNDVRAGVYADVIHQVFDIFDGFVLGVQP